jgi:hypothetical protein
VLENPKKLYVRGNTVEAARRFTEKYKGTPAFDAFVNSLNETQSELIKNPAEKFKWYDLALYASIIDIASKHLNPEDPRKFLLDLGRFVMDEGVTTLYRAFFLIASPSFVLRGSALLWRMFFKGSKLKIVSHSKKWVKVAITGAAFCDVSLCTSISGGILAALEHAGAKGVQLEHHSCCSLEGTQCDFYFSWR